MPNSIDTPNLVIPLAFSFNQRGIDGYTNLVTNNTDQQKINAMYMPIKNAMTGNTTLYVVKRPGIILDPDNATFGTSGQVAYLVSYGANLGGTASSNNWLFSTSGTDVRASDSGGTTTVITTGSGLYPIYVDHSSIGGNDTVVLQVGTTPRAQTVWYSTAIGTWTQITDADFPDISGKMEFLDGYAFVLNDSSNVQRVYNSDVNSLANWTATSYITKQIQQDTTSGLMRVGNLIVAFGQETMEVFRNAGNASGSPLESVQQLAQKIGCDASNVVGHYYCTIGNRAYFLSRKTGFRTRQIGMFQGGQVEIVSTPAIDAIIMGTGIRSINRINFRGMDAVGVMLSTVSDATQRALLFFPDYNEWFEWTSTVFCPVNSGTWFLGVGSNQHKLYTMPTTDNWQDAGSNFDSTLQFTLPQKGNQKKTADFFAIQGDTPSSSSTITIKVRDNDESSFTSLGTIDLATPNKIKWKGGVWRGRRDVQLVNSGNFEGRMEQFLARIT